MGLFDKKVCDVCGNTIKLLGNRKLTDGNLCKDCANKLSPWFSDRRSSTVSEIKDQLAYRADNEKKLAEFNPTLTLGEGSVKVHIDEKAKTFIVARGKNWQSANPDLINISQVKDCEIEISEDREEEFMEEEDGKQKSYNPPKFNYEYEFDVRLDIDSPYYSEIEFELTDEEITSIGEVYKYYEALGRKIQNSLMPEKYPLIPSMQAILKEGITAARRKDEDAARAEEEQETANNDESVRWFCPNCGTECFGNFCVKCGNKKPI